MAPTLSGVRGRDRDRVWVLGFGFWVRGRQLTDALGCDDLVRVGVLEHT